MIPILIDFDNNFIYIANVVGFSVPKHYIMVIRRNRENAASLSPRSCIIPKPKKESEKKSTIGRTIRNYGLNATPHGLFHIAEDGRPYLERMIWIVIMIPLITMMATLTIRKLKQYHALWLFSS